MTEQPEYREVVADPFVPGEESRKKMERPEEELRHVQENIRRAISELAQKAKELLPQAGPSSFVELHGKDLMLVRAQTLEELQGMCLYGVKMPVIAGMEGPIYYLLTDELSNQDFTFSHLPHRLPCLFIGKDGNLYETISFRIFNEQGIGYSMGFVDSGTNEGESISEALTKKFGEDINKVKKIDLIPDVNVSDYKEFEVKDIDAVAWALNTIEASRNSNS